MSELRRSVCCVFNNGLGVYNSRVYFHISKSYVMPSLSTYSYIIILCLNLDLYYSFRKNLVFGFIFKYGNIRS